jgi:hypothetical protein
MERQSAVDWLIDEMLKEGYFDGNKPLSFTNLDHLQNKAKEIEKQHIIDAFNNEPECDGDGDKYYKQVFEDYYR